MTTPNAAPGTEEARTAARAAAALAASNTARGILLMILAVSLLSALDVTIKWLTSSLPIMQIVWGRYTFHVLFLALYLIATNRSVIRVLRTQRPWLQTLRALTLLGTSLCFMTALVYLPLAETSALTFTGPLIATALSMPLLGEKVGPRRWAAIVAGFIGVLIIIRPGLGIMHWAVILPLCAAVMFAFYQLQTRILATVDPPLTTLMHSALIAVPIMTLFLPFNWTQPGPVDWVLMCLTGILGAGGHLMMIRAMGLTDIGALAPIIYLQLVWALIFGLLIFGDFPDIPTLIGAAIITGSGVYIWWRERRLASAAN